MEIKMKQIKMLLSVLILFSSLLIAQDEVTKHPGYVDFGNFEGLYDPDQYTEINIEGPLLKLVSNATQEDKELSSMLQELKLIKVYNFTVKDEMNSDIKDKIDRITKKLSSEKWERIVKVKDKGEDVGIYVKYNNDKIAGLTVLARENSGEASFINIVGHIDLNAISKLSDRFDIPELNNLKNNKKK